MSGDEADNSTRAELLEHNFEQAKELVQKMRAGTSTLYDTQNLNRVFDPNIDIRFNEAGVAHNLYDHDTGEYVKVTDTIKAQKIAESDAPDDLNTIDKYNQKRISGELKQETLQNVINATPTLKGFTIDDAVSLANGETATRVKFKDADPNIMQAAAYIMLDQNKSKLEISHPDFAKKHPNTDFADMASVSTFYKAEDDQTYKEWEAGKRAEIISGITSSPQIMADLEKLRSSTNISKSDEIVEQYQIRERIADNIGAIFAKTYGLDNLDASDITVIHKSLDDYYENPEIAGAWQTQHGVNNDEAVIISYNPIKELMFRDQLALTDSDTRELFLKTTIEELQHTTDNIYGDNLVNGKLKPEHPAFDHTAMVVLNTLNYTTSSSDHEGYKMQHVERTAKEVAEEISEAINNHIENPDQEIKQQEPEQNQSTPSTHKFSPANIATTSPPGGFQI